jgi:hypothetical protein
MASSEIPTFKLDTISTAGPKNTTGVAMGVLEPDHRAAENTATPLHQHLPSRQPHSGQRFSGWQRRCSLNGFVRAVGKCSLNRALGADRHGGRSATGPDAV